MKLHARGMTLIELITAMTVLAILVAIAVPSFRTFTDNARISGSTNDLVGAMNFARSEALRRANRVTVCASTDQATCVDSTAWNTGWIAFNDPNGNAVVNAGEQLLQVWAPTAANIQVNSTQRAATYNSMGMAQLPPGETSVTFTIQRTACDKDRPYKQTVLSASGGLQTTTLKCP